MKFLLLLSLLGLSAYGTTIPVTGSGQFVCGFQPESSTGYASNIEASLGGQDAQSNPITVTLSASDRNAARCMSSLPQMSVSDTNVNAIVNYLGITYNSENPTVSQFGCEEYTGTQDIGPCMEAFTSQTNGLMTLAITPCTEFSGHCLLSGATPFLLEGLAQLTSLNFSSPPPPAYYSSSGTFSIASPEPRTYMLILCGLFLMVLGLYGRTNKRFPDRTK